MSGSVEDAELAFDTGVPQGFLQTLALNERDGRVGRAVHYEKRRVVTRDVVQG